MSNLKKIKVVDLRLGMFLQGFDGSWLKHPFWKSKFLLLEAAELRAAHDSGLAECWIDLSRGADVAAPSALAGALAPEPEHSAPQAQAQPEAPEAVVASSFHDELQRAATLCKGARDATMLMFNEARLGNAIDAQACLPLVTEIADSLLRNPGALISLARLKTSDDYTYMHSVAVCALMVALGRALGLDEVACRDAGVAGLLHDIGKAFIPLAILNKPGKLTDEEFEAVKSHPVRGHALLMEGQAASAAVLDVCLHHHEKFDGAGYPERLQGEAISLMARMGAVCDVYDAITSNRPYKAGWDPAESVARMISWKGHFDQTVLSAFIKTLGIYPTGALVKMRSGRLAVVVEQNASSLTKPVVKVFFSTKADTYIPVERIDLAHAGAGDTIVGREARDKWNLALIDELWAGELAPRHP
ncbi:HD-GYP domain-containing protein (c-di-GMP phosphodiesterase class II) [Oxalobacteraceae bacterium GrIS 1.11]